jgi:hypothetical protein
MQCAMYAFVVKVVKELEVVCEVYVSWVNLRKWMGRRMMCSCVRQVVRNYSNWMC